MGGTFRVAEAGKLPLTRSRAIVLPSAYQRVLRSRDLHVLERARSSRGSLHAYHAGRHASVSADGKVLAGGLEPGALRFVREWAGLRNEEILANWERARKNEPLLDIEPLP